MRRGDIHIQQRIALIAPPESIHVLKRDVDAVWSGLFGQGCIGWDLDVIDETLFAGRSGVSCLRDNPVVAGQQTMPPLTRRLARLPGISTNTISQLECLPSRRRV